jgi:hypothetical protein
LKKTSMTSWAGYYGAGSSSTSSCSAFTNGGLGNG